MELIQENNKTISDDKSNTCFLKILGSKSSQILVPDSISKEKFLKPFWNECAKAKSDLLPLPTKIASANLDLELLKSWHISSIQNSWFSTNNLFLHNKNSSKTSLLSSTSFPARSTDCENIRLKSKKIRISPNVEQKKILSQWFGAARFCYNKTVELLKQSNTRADWKAIKTDLIKALPEWATDIPYQIKSIAIKDACQAVATAKRKYIRLRKIQKIKFKSRKRNRDSIYLPKAAIINDQIYKRTLKKIAFKEKLPKITNDCRLSKENGQYYLIIPVPIETIVIDNQEEIVALDPGVRTFQSFYSVGGYGKLGCGDFARIYRLCLALDRIQSKISKEKHRKKQKLIKVAVRVRFKIRNLIDEAHHKIARWFCLNYKAILIPTFETQNMVSKLHSKTARAMLTWAHYRFKQFLKFKGREFGCKVIEVDEAYTSKTCGLCGKINNIGSNKIFKCRECKVSLDRDLHAARNILMRYLLTEDNFVR